MSAETIEDVYGLSSLQQGILFESLHSDPTVYVQQFSFRVTTTVFVEAYRKAWQRSLDRHAVLRTSFHWEDVEQPVQVVERGLGMPLQYEDWSELPGPEQTARLDAHLQQDRRRGFDLSKAPLLRVTLVRLTDASYQLIISFHHIILDGWSVAVLFTEVASLYEAYCCGSELALPPTTQYGSYIAWLQSQDQSAAETYWRKALTDYKGPAPLPIDRPRIRFAGTDATSDELHLRLSAETTASLRTFGRRFQLTLNSVIQGAWALLLSRYLGVDDVVFGAVVSGRPTAVDGVESMVGFFINTLPVRTHVRPEDPLVPWLKQLQADQLNAREYDYTPLAKIQGWSEMPRGSPLFHSLMAFENYPVAAFSNRDYAGVIAKTDFIEGTGYPLSVCVVPREELEVKISYFQQHFEAATIARMLGHFRELLLSMTADPEKRLGELVLLTEGEKRQLLVEWAGTVAAYPSDKCIHELFEEQARRTPAAIAVLDDHQRLTFGQVNEKANQLACYLRNRGVIPDSLVGICLERSANLVIAVLAILKAGGAYLPLDPAYPAARIAATLEDACPNVLLTSSHLNVAEGVAQRNVICLDREDERIRQQPAENLPVNVTPGNLAYVIYTSGSTGTPRGTLMEHGALVNHAFAVAQDFKLTPADRVLQFASPAFDVFAEELFPTLISGAALLPRPEAMTSSFDAFHEFIAAQQLTVLNLPASYWHEWVSDMEDSGTRLPDSLRLVVVGNERVMLERWTQWLSLAGTRIESRNAYGPTEAAITATLHAPSAEGPVDTGSVPIGRPIANVQVFILDPMLQPVPIGIPGELYIGGAGLARGYLNQPESTASAFVPHPFSAGARLYRTGDIGRYLSDGNIEFLGRTDNQVKIRGHRVELEEVEHALEGCPHVLACAVAACDDELGRKRLIAYVVPPLEPELWPSIGEYFLHDPVMYHAMTRDEHRNRAYRVAIGRYVKDKVVLDIGTGADAILARFCVESGARRVYGIEKLDSSYTQASELLARLGLEDRIVLRKGESTKVQLPEKVDVCVSELLGMIGSSEGVINILNDARRFLKDDGVMIPFRCVTQIAAVFLPDELASNPRFTELSGPYAEKIFEAVGHPLDVRVCIRNFPDANVVSDSQVFEDLDFRGVIPERLSSEITLTVTRRARIDGFLLWLNLYTVEDEMIDVRRENHNWLPVYFPAFYPGIEVSPGDAVRAVCSVEPGGSSGSMPDYRIQGSLARGNSGAMAFDFQSSHAGRNFRQSPFYQKLFADGCERTYSPLYQLAPDIRAFLRERVPEHLIPSAFVTLKALPRLPNGKLDRQLLPAQNDVAIRQTRGFEAARNPVEKKLTELWTEILGVARVGIDDNFFELGGDSIVSIQLASRARREGIGITVNQLFQYPSVAELARVAEIAPEIANAEEVASGNVPLTAIQRWFFEQGFAHASHSNQAVLLELRQPLDSAIASQVIRSLVRRHDALRLRFVSTDDGWRQFYALVDDVEVSVDQVDLSGVSEPDRASAIEVAAAEIQSSLDISRGPLFRVALFDLGPQTTQRLLFVIHHLSVDGVSWRILMEDFWTAYAQLTRREPVQLPAKTTSFQAWAERITEYALRSKELRREVDFWVQVTRGTSASLPTDRPSGENTMASARTVRVSLAEEETTALLQEVPRAYQTQINDVLLTALAQACGHWTGSGTLLLYLEGHGREGILEGVDLSRTVGWFTSLFPVRLDLRNTSHPGEALKSIKEQLRRIPHRGIGYALLRYLSGDAPVSRELAALPTIELTFNYLGQFGHAVSKDAPVAPAKEDAGPLSSLEDRRVALLDINGIVSEGKLQFAWTYSENIHYSSTIENLAADFISALRALIDHCLSPEAGGYTPSDFSKARLSQKDLDRFLGNLGPSAGSTPR